MTIFAVEYTYDDTRSADLDQTRPEHRAFLRSLHDSGTLVASGPWVDASAPGALLLVRADDEDGALASLDADPFHRVGLITRRTARAWNPVIGDLS